jgi:putative methionine-R-sulfoxide reductase with GAF domain
MSSESSLNLESFQRLLASAFAVQESHIDSQFLSALVEVQRLITKGELGVEGAMDLVVDSAREVANAAGVAIGLLEGDQLLYKAGSGCSAAYKGNRVGASLTVSAHTKAKREILRVEDAQTDTRIEAAICRQFGAESLLILPIYHEGGLAGVLEILFEEAHCFQDREVSTYRLMAGLIETALLRRAQTEQRQPGAGEMLPQAGQLAPPKREEHSDDWEMLYPRRGSRYQRWGSALAAIQELPALKQPGVAARAMMQRARDFSSHVRHWNVILASVAGVIAIISLFTFGGHRPSSASGSSDSSKSAAAVGQFERAKESPGDGTTDSSGQPATVVLKEARLTGNTIRRVQVGRDEIDYLGDDVTVRHFAHKDSPQRRAVGASRVSYIGKDVTVRYFMPKSQGNSNP